LAKNAKTLQIGRLSTPRYRCRLRRIPRKYRLATPAVSD
jgi:hypothetical protein